MSNDNQILTPRQKTLLEIDAIGRRHYVTLADLMKEKHKQGWLNVVRRECFKYLREQGWSYPAIGQFFNRHHTGIILALRHTEAFKVSEDLFRDHMIRRLKDADLRGVGMVTGPGRSGAIAAVYASHYLGVPFIPYGSPMPEHLGRLLIVDTDRSTGRTMRKAMSRYASAKPIDVVAFEENPRVTFWYEHLKGETQLAAGTQQRIAV